MMNLFGKQSVVDFVCFYIHNMAITENGELFGWGDNSFDQLGLDTREDNILSPRCIHVLEGKEIVTFDYGFARHTTIIGVARSDF